MFGDLSSGGVGGLNVRQVLRRLGEPLQVLDIDHRGYTATPAGQEDRLVFDADIVDDLIEPATRNRDRQVEHDPSMGEGRSFHASSSRSESNLRLYSPLAAVASELRDQSPGTTTIRTRPCRPRRAQVPCPPRPTPLPCRIRAPPLTTSAPYS